MDEEHFSKALQELISKARIGEKILLDDLIGLLDAEIEGLKMAHAEGEEF